MATVYNPAKVVASQQTNGPIVQSVPFSELGVLATNYVTDYPNFLRLLDQYVNMKLYTIESGQPEGSAMKLIIPNVKGNAAAWAQAIDQQWQKGKIIYPDTGKAVKAWPGASQVAYSQESGNALVLEWIKEGPEAWILIGVILTLIAAYAIYTLLHQSPYTMSAYTPATGTGTTGTTTGTTPITTPGQAAGGILVWSEKNWPVLVLGGGLLIATPFVMRELARTREAENEYRYAERGGY